MSSQLKQRVARIIAGGTHALLNKIEDAAPVAMLEQHVRELDSLTDEVRTELGKVVANRHLSQQHYAALNQEHDQISAALATAIESGRDELASTAIGRQMDIEAQLPIIEVTLTDLSQQERDLSSYIDAMMGKRREMRLAIAQFEATQKQSAGTVSSGGASVGSAKAVESQVSKVQSDFDDTFRRATGVDRLAAQATLQQSIQLNELKDLSREQAIANRLATIKQQRES